MEYQLRILSFPAFRGFRKQGDPDFSSAQNLLEALDSLDEIME